MAFAEVALILSAFFRLKQLSRDLVRQSPEWPSINAQMPSSLASLSIFAAEYEKTLKYRTNYLVHLDADLAALSSSELAVLKHLCILRNLPSALK